MIKSLLVALIVIIPVALSTVLIVATRIQQISEPEKIQALGLERACQSDATDFGVLALAFGVIVTIAFVLVSQRWPALANDLMPVIGITLAILLSVLAAVVRPQAGLSGVPEIIVLNMIWGAGYGWLLPVVIRNFDLLFH